MYLAWNQNSKVTHSKPQEGLAISTELFLITTPCTAKTTPLSSGLLKAPTIALHIKPATLCFADQYSAFAHHLTLRQPWGSFQFVLRFTLRYYHYKFALVVKHLNKPYQISLHEVYSQDYRGSEGGLKERGWGLIVSWGLPTLGKC